MTWRTRVLSIILDMDGWFLECLCCIVIFVIIITRLLVIIGSGSKLDLWSVPGWFMVGWLGFGVFADTILPLTVDLVAIIKQN